MIILIPAFEPDARLVSLVADLRAGAEPFPVLVVDDGSGADYRPVFDAVRALGAEVIGHPVNLGKGCSLKAGFRHILSRYPGAAVVCADSDGQHRVRDIVRVADRVRQHAGRADAPVVLGARRFTGTVPLRSRVGNTLARQAFRFSTTVSLRDTQTGLRGYPASLLAGLVGVDGNRFEYELNTLLEASRVGRRIEEVDIETVYLHGNASSHFRPVVDSLRVMRPLLVYGAVSFGSFLIDLLALQAFVAVTGVLGASVVAARLLSASVNFLLNRTLVFAGTRPHRVRREAAAYAGLAVALLAASYAGLSLLTRLGVPLLAAKLLTDATLYLVGFQVQRRVVFRRSPVAPQPPSSTVVVSPSAARDPWT
ncbi:GtrA family protein [Cryobacterium sp.]|jgi:putative flippase GtrA|uniref:GtrA family protein n=1 Tax=Cryobacterium sp. TaxID=1926290 RepID=UPI00262FFEFB|nr:GtrA family protein [Cryobacterium sp.]MCU1446660.1 Dolichyl-phosphate beta-D-mannosyltransferase [Cryobacterium sp.]